jgi:hypothetical protein
LIECTFFAAIERAESAIKNTGGLARRPASYQVSYPQWLWATLAFSESPRHGALRSVCVAKSLLHARPWRWKRTVTMLQSHNDSLSNLE